MIEQAAPSAARSRRADACRNDECLLATATAVFAEIGPNAPLDDIARRAGVGIGTLYRHFPNRQALLEAVFRSHMEALGAEAEGLLGAPVPGDALATWLRAVLVYNVTQRGLKEAMVIDQQALLVSACKVRMLAAGAALLARAQQSGAVRLGLDIGDLLRLVHSIALATEHAPAAGGQAERLLAVMLDGLRQQAPPAG